MAQCRLMFKGFSSELRECTEIIIDVLKNDLRNKPLRQELRGGIFPMFFGSSAIFLIYEGTPSEIFSYVEGAINTFLKELEKMPPHDFLQGSIQKDPTLDNVPLKILNNPTLGLLSVSFPINECND